MAFFMRMGTTCLTPRDVIRIEYTLYIKRHIHITMNGRNIA